ncbi:hypothetical protein MMC13_004148 [Lambiella insularis]|nr:hypothetical protein [Lambiella insularis]
MAHPQQHQYGSHYSPPRSTPSPYPGAYQLPPNKRQRLSPNPQSPYTSPSISNGSLPNQIFSSPNFGAQPNGHAPPRPYVEPPQAPPPAGAMGPPLRPVDKPVDVHDLTDVLSGSGVDLREEEAALFNRFDSSNQQPNGNFLPMDLSATIGTNGYQASNYNPYGQYNTLSQNVPGDRGSFYGAGTLNQPAVSVKTLEQQLDEQRKRALRRKAERQQYHLNDPFLYGGVVQHRLMKQTHVARIALPQDGLLTSNNQGGQPLQLAVAGPDQNEVIVMLKGQDLLYSKAPLVEILTLVSLAAQERLKTIVEDTATLAKGRREGSHGVVPAELADLALGNGKADPALLPTPGNSAVSPRTNPLKRSFSEANKLPTPISDGATTPNTITFPNQTTQVLRKTSGAERTIDEERAAKRNKRTVSSLMSGEQSRSGSISGAASIPGTPGTIGERAPEVEVKKGSKKDQKRQADAKATEAQQHAATNQTINMQLGGGGKKKPSWMTSAKATPIPTGFPVPSRLNTIAQAQAKAANGGGAGGLPQSGRQFGDFREDKENGAGIQMRDVVMVLEPESKEKKTLAKATAKLNPEKPGKGHG